VRGGVAPEFLPAPFFGPKSAKAIEYYFFLLLDCPTILGAVHEVDCV
jgi:hypothetical protein